jgi:ribonuclease PH
MRYNTRAAFEMREVSFEVNYTKHAKGSCLIKVGDTWVLCTASIEDRVPPFLRNTGKGWINAEYSMLPGSTEERVTREIVKGKQGGRTLEIQRLISRSLRAAVNLDLLGEKMINIDCDVLQADGGTRTAAINGGYVALQIALRSLNKAGLMHKLPFIRHLAAISCGVVNGQVLLDLDYSEDSKADVDANFVCTSEGKFVEVQFTGEKNTFDQEVMTSMMNLAKGACLQIIDKQKAAIMMAIA